jgi:hypothetical protein
MNDSLIQALLQVAQARSDALVQKDSDTMNRILADEFVYINSRGEVLTKTEYIEDYVVSPDVRWTSQTLEAIHTQVYDSTAILRCRVHDVGTFSGQPFVGTFQSLFVYRRDTDTWRCVAGQTTTIA